MVVLLPWQSARSGHPHWRQLPPLSAARPLRTEGRFGVRDKKWQKLSTASLFHEFCSYIYVAPVLLCDTANANANESEQDKNHFVLINFCFFNGCFKPINCFANNSKNIASCQPDQPHHLHPVNKLVFAECCTFAQLS